MGKRLFIVIVSIFIIGTCVNAEAKAKLRFATQDFYPFSYMENHKVAGPGADIIRAVCKKIDVECELTLQPWRRSQAMVRKGHVDCIFMIGKNKERENWIIFSPAVMNIEYGFFYCMESPFDFTTPRSLSGKTIGVYGPSNTSHQLKELAGKAEAPVNIIESPDALTQFKKLSRCRVDAVYSNRAVGLSIIKDIKATNIKYGTTHKRLDYYFGFSEKHAPHKLVRKFNEQLLKMKKSGELNRILLKYGLRMSS